MGKVGALPYSLYVVIHVKWKFFSCDQFSLRPLHIETKLVGLCRYKASSGRWFLLVGLKSREASYFWLSENTIVVKKYA